jgi:hypothetical protein
LIKIKIQCAAKSSAFAPRLADKEGDRAQMAASCVRE